MKLPDRIFTWDVLIVSGPGRATALAHELEADLVLRRLKVKLRPLTSSSPLPLPKEVEESARQAAFCVALAARYSEGGDERIAYAIMPAPKFIGQVASFAKPSTQPGPNEVEIGMIEGDVGNLASRVADRISGSRR